jgi:drug/metabolite transporter (DMT)-like permease
MNNLVIILAMAVAALLGGIGQVAMKKASGIPLMQALGWLLLFASCYGIGVIINYLVYRAGAKVSVAYPVISLSYIFSAIIAWKFLGEQISATSITGMGLITLGVALIGWGAV